jgi:branched-chain amino acid transport system substrate-binding protein
MTASARRPKIRLAALSAAALTLPLLLASCSSSGSKSGSSGGNSGGSSGGSTGGTSASNAALGTPNKATGSPITVMISNPGKLPSIDTTDGNTAAKSVVKYANDYLGGINGHVINLKECFTKGTPAGETDCANQAVQAKAAAVVQASGDDVTAKALNKAGIMDWLNVGASPATLGTPTVYSMANPLAVYGVPAAYGKSIGAKNAVILVIDVPGASGPASQLGPLFFGNAGVKLKVVTIAPGTADMTSQVQATLGAKPEEYFVLGDPTFCTPAIKAVKTLAPSAKIIEYTTCIGSSSAGIPGGYANTKAVSSQDLDQSTTEYKLFSAILKKYGGSTTAGQSAFSYAPTLGLIRMLSAAKLTDLTAKGVLAAVKTAPAVTLPLGGDTATFQCNGKQISVSPFVCSAVGSVADVAANGSLSNFKPLGDSSIYAKP